MDNLYTYPLSAVKLPLSFDPFQLEQDLERIPNDAWHSHYNPREYEGDWAVAPLRSVGGHKDVVYAVPGAAVPNFYKNSPLLDLCPYLGSIIGQFDCPTGAARLMRLGPGAKILEHCDDMGLGDRVEFRLHIPLTTHPDVHFWLDGREIPMRPGELWYADFSKAHRVENNSNIARIHLVLDCKPNDWLDALIQRGIEFTRIETFLNEIGIPTSVRSLNADTFLPGISIEGGAIYYDPQRVISPGDLLHEAGHIAVSERRKDLNGNVGEGDENAMGDEIAAILWSWAALKEANVPERSVFHENGYKGHSDWYIDNFSKGIYMGLPLLEWMGLCASPGKAREMGVDPFPKMLKWLRN